MCQVQCHHHSVVRGGKLAWGIGPGHAISAARHSREARGEPCPILEREREREREREIIGEKENIIMGTKRFKIVYYTG